MVEPTAIATPFLTQGMLGATVVALACALLWVVKKWDTCRIENAALQKQHADELLELQEKYSLATLALTERVIVGLNAANIAISDNTKVVAANTKAVERGLP